MSKNKYILPFASSKPWFIEFGGTNKKNSHSWDMISQRYAYDFEIRKNDLPYHNDLQEFKNYYSYLEPIIAPYDGWVIELINRHQNTHITKDRQIICDVDDPKGNYIVLKHPNGEYSTLCHFEKDTFKVQLGDLVKQGDILGLVGNSGNTQGPHIHFQVQQGPNPDTDKGIKISFTKAYHQNKKIKHLEKGIEIESRFYNEIIRNK